MKRSSRLVVAAVVTAISALIIGSSCASAPPPEAAQGLTWTPCPDRGVPVECTSVPVPVDWSRPDGATIPLEVGRLRATGERLGAVMFNPGGPGGSGLSFLSGFSSRFGQQMREHFDLVSWDPRGVGGSAPLTCPDGAGRELSTLGIPSTVGERQQYEKVAAQWARTCREASGPLFDHVDTLSNVQDLDRLRELLGEEKLNFAGFSYGSRIALLYADVLPERVGRLVVDGVIDPTSDGADFIEGATRAMEQAFTDYVAGCADRESCPLIGMTAVEVRSGLAPLAVKYPEVGGTIAGLVRDPDNWPQLDRFLSEVRAGKYPSSSDSGSDISNQAVNCLDLPDRRNAVQVMADARRSADRYPVLGRLTTATVLCPQWPVPTTYQPHRITANGSAPILVVGTTHDTVTPYDWAVSVARNLQNGRLLTNKATHHGGYGSSACVTDAVDRYFVDGTLPPVGKVCTS
jgi:pimeloyl-ACP methyl ester carboxylesterase